MLLVNLWNVILIDAAIELDLVAPTCCRICLKSKPWLPLAAMEALDLDIGVCGVSVEAVLADNLVHRLDYGWSYGVYWVNGVPSLSFEELLRLFALEVCGTLALFHLKQLVVPKSHFLDFWSLHSNSSLVFQLCCTLWSN